MIIHLAIVAILMVLASAGARRSIKTGEQVRQHRANRPQNDAQLRHHWEALSKAAPQEDVDYHWNEFNRLVA